MSTTNTEKKNANRWKLALNRETLRILSYVASAVLLLVGALPLIACGQGLDAGRDETTSIYTAVIANGLDVLQFTDFDRLVVLNHTTNDGVRLGEFDGLKQRMPDLSRDTYERLSVVWPENRPLTIKQFQFDKPVDLISDEEVQSIFGTEGGRWEEFYRRFPRAAGLISLSAIGLGDGGQALVYFGAQFADLNGGGLLLLLVKHEGRWIVEQTVGLWVS